MNYVLKNLAELSTLLRAQADRVQNSTGLDGKISRADQALNLSMANGLRAGANIVDMTILQDMPLSEEYAIAYENAVSYAASQVWASMQRHKGDPCWEYAGGSWALRGEVRT
jgi:hypothetical protein